MLQVNVILVIAYLIYYVLKIEITSNYHDSLYGVG